MNHTDVEHERNGYTYDGLGRLIRVSENSVNTCYEYDAADNLTLVRQNASVSSGGACSGGQTRTFAYDKLGRVTASTQTTAGDAARTFAYEYNADGTVKTQTYPSGLKVAYEYDEAGRPKAVGKNTVGKKEYASEMAYAAHGGLRTMKPANGLYESRGYNARMQPTGRTAWGRRAKGEPRLRSRIPTCTMGILRSDFHGVER